MIETLAVAVVVLAGLYFLVLAAVSLLAPAQGRRFLLGFAGSASAHYTELGVRLLVGGAFVRQAPGMLFPDVFAAFGWLLVATTAALLLVPWHWHRRFAAKTVPQALRFLPLIGLASLAIGGFILAAVWYGR